MPSDLPAHRTADVLLALARAEALGWRTITLGRLQDLASGDLKRMPPDPATAPRSSRGTYTGDHSLRRLLDTGADRDAAVRRAAITEAADALDAQSCTCGCRRAVEFLRTLAATATAED